MNRNFRIRRKYFNISIIFLFVLSTCNISAQTELEIKTSGKYFWGQGIDNTEELSKKAARNELMEQISINIPNNQKLNSKCDIIVDSIEYISFSRGPKVRALAFVEKVLVNNITTTNEFDVVQLHYTEKKNDALLTNQNQPNNTEIQTINDSLNKIIVLSKTAVEQPIQQSNQENVDTMHFNNCSKSNDKYENLKNQSEILQFLLKANNINDVSDLLRKKRSNGSLNYDIYGNKTISSDRNYLLIFDPLDGQIIAFLDKGITPNRINLKNNEKIDNFTLTYKKMRIIWIQLY